MTSTTKVVETKKQDLTPNNLKNKTENVTVGRHWIYVESGAGTLAHVTNNFACISKIFKIVIYSSALFFKSLPPRLEHSFKNLVSIFEDATRAPGDLHEIMQGSIKKNWKNGNYLAIPATVLFITVDFIGIVTFASAVKLVNLGPLAQGFGNISVFGCKVFSFVAKTSLGTVYLVVFDLALVVDLGNTLHRLYRNDPIKEDNPYEQFYKVVKAVFDVAFITLLAVGVTQLYIIAPLGIITAVFGLVYDADIIPWKKMVPAET